MKTQHAQTPWETSVTSSLEWDVCKEGGGDCIAHIMNNDAESEANAAFIVRACNNHEALIKTVKAIQELIDQGESDHPSMAETLFQIGEIIDNAITNATKP